MKSLTCKVRLDKDTLSQGTRLDDRLCPIQSQVREQLDSAGVYPDTKYVSRVSNTFFGVIRMGNNRYTAKVSLPREAQTFISLFDQHKDSLLLPMLPMEFSLEIPIRD